MKPEKKNEKRIKAKLFYATVALVVGIVVLAGASFAWYTLSTNPEIKGIKASINADQAIQVSLNNKTYNLSTELLSIPENLAPLIPVSTVDGLNWFICKYDVKGNVLQKADTDKYEGTQFMYLRFPDGGNVQKDAGKIVKKELGNLSEKLASYYVYTDIYLKTEMGETDVYLSRPSETEYTPQDTEQNHYGTYVLSYEYDEEQKKVTAMNKASDTAVRVGFMVLGDVEDGEGKDAVPEESDLITHPEYYYVTSNGINTTGDNPETETIEKKDSNRFVIYEPNADSRSYADKANADFNADLYIAGFKARVFRTADSTPLMYKDLDGYYLQTYPIRATDLTYGAIRKLLLTGDEEGDDKAAKINTLKETFYAPQVENPTPDDYEKTWKINGQDITVDGATGKVDGIPSYFDLNNMTIQKTSLWRTGKNYPNPSELEEDMSLREFFNSTRVGYMGEFLVQNPDPDSDDESKGINLHYKKNVAPEDLNSDYTAVKISDTDKKEYRGYSKITTLYKDVPQKIRIYFWIEGQDVDCWNDIAYTNFLVNLEFVGDVIKEEAPVTQATE